MLAQDRAGTLALAGGDRAQDLVVLVHAGEEMREPSITRYQIRSERLKYRVSVSSRYGLPVQR